MSISKRFSLLLSTMFGIGFVKFMPGTVASFISIIIAHFLYALYGKISVQIILLLIFFISIFAIIKTLKENYNIYSKRIFKIPEKIELSNRKLERKYKKEDIIESYKFLIEKNENKKNKNAINIEKIAIIETVTIASKVKDIFKELVKKQKFIFSKLCASKKYTKLETVTAFSGVLELSKRNKIITNQEKNFGDIIVEKK